ncbi:MAG: hypothetical protein GC180_01330 [Bacteroidetes bacterium]|nr:hypothetical protein [Bacteroidota bacterium]
MRTSILCLLFIMVVSGNSRAQSLERHTYFEVSAGKGFASGKMTELKPGYLTYQGSWSFNMGFTHYSKEGQLGRKDLFGYHFGYQFHANSLDESVLNQINPSPNTYQINKGSQLMHGPVFRMEYTRSGRFAPYVGLGAHLLAVRPATFQMNYLPQDNYYQTNAYTSSPWGRINACFSAFTGFHIVMPGDWTIGLNYEVYLRDAWTSRYKVTSTPSAIDQKPVETDFNITHTAWVSHAELRVQFPLH